ncbi:MAG: hypothetical protein IPJ23_14430 [Ignavibacteriales bacterium]|nr:hypothetical protein [Ignavibacteriales bacterium]MBK7631874.1 hypothetical protein [Ignavibacteriales bacterium]
MKEFSSFYRSNLLIKVFVLTFIFLFSLPSFAQEVVKKDLRYGGYARLYSMGDNPFIVDPDNIKSNPAYSSMYSNFLWGDIGSNNGIADEGIGQFAGFNYSLNKEFTLGALLARNDFNSSSIGSLDPGGLVNLVNTNATGADIVALNNNFELLSSYRFGNFVLGLGLSYASTTNDFTPATGTGDKNSASQLGVNVGFMADLSPSFKFDVDFALALPSATYEPGTGDKVSASNTFMAANVRAFLKLSNKFTLVPIVGFYNGSGKVDVGAQSTDLPSMMSLSAGVGLAYQVENLIISGGPSFAYQSTTTASVANASPELKNSTLTFPAWNLGAEWYFTDWLIGRLGYVASTYSRTNQTFASSTTVDENSRTGFDNGDVRLGVGFRFGGFNLDATVNDDVLRQGLNLIGGGTRTFAYLSASYGF